MNLWEHWEHRLEIFNVNLAHSFTKHHDVNSTDLNSSRSSRHAPGSCSILPNSASRWKTFWWLLMFARNTESFGDGISRGRMSDSFNWTLGVFCDMEHHIETSYVLVWWHNRDARCRRLTSGYRHMKVYRKSQRQMTGSVRTLVIATNTDLIRTQTYVQRTD